MCVFALVEQSSLSVELGEHLGFHLRLREGGVLALLLQHHDVPAAVAYQRHGLVIAVLAEGAAARRIALVGQLVAHRGGHLLHHQRQVVHIRVTVADKQHVHPLLGVAGACPTGKQQGNTDGNSPECQVLCSFISHYFSVFEYYPCLFRFCKETKKISNVGGKCYQWHLPSGMQHPRPVYRTTLRGFMSCTIYSYQHRRCTVFCPTVVGLQSDLSRS